MSDVTTKSTVGAWEYFCDVAYYDMWCVRRMGERTFGQGFHVLNHGSAKELAEELARMDTEAAAHIAALEAQLAATEHKFSVWRGEVELEHLGELQAQLAARDAAIAGWLRHRAWKRACNDEDTCLTIADGIESGEYRKGGSA